MSRTQTLHRSDLFGFVPGGHVLDTEMAYGGYDPQDWHGRRGGPVVAEEEEYGDDDHFSLHDEDDDVAFGGDLEDVPLFGGEGKDADDVDNALDEILHDMDKDSFGADPMAVSPEVEAQRDALTGLIRDGIRNAFWGESKAASDSWGKMFRKGADYVSDQFEKSMPGDLEEIAQALMAQGIFSHWNDLSEDDRNLAVANAIRYAAVPGIEHATDDAAVAAWKNGTFFTASNAKSLIWTALSDANKTFYSALAENPLFGNLMQATGMDPSNADQMVNMRAMFLVLCMSVGLRVDSYIAHAISQDQGVVAAIASAEQAQSGANYPQGPQGPQVSIEAEAVVEELNIMPPVQELPDSGYSMPPPEQILAFGYGLSILGSLMGIFR